MTKAADRSVPPTAPLVGWALGGLAALLLCSADIRPARAEEAGPPAVPASPCRESVTEETMSAADGSELVLASGRRIRIVDVRLVEDGAAGPARAWLSSLAGSGVAVAAIGEADRWGRVPAAVRLNGSPPIDLAELLVGEGFAIVDAGPRDELCRTGLLAVEAVARERKRGAWARSAWPIPARDGQALAASVGRFALVEGRVVSVGERRDRTYLNFGRNWSTDFSVTIPRRSWGTLKARGVTAAGLTGARVLVRGVIEARRAPSLDIAAPDMLQVVEAPRGAREKR